LKLALMFLLAAAAAYPQKLFSFGAKIGHPFEDVLHSQLTLGSILTPSSGRYTLGPTVELNLPHRVSIEADILFRPIRFDAQTLGVTTDRITGYEWRFPLLAKYRLKGGRVRPYLAGGPAWQAVTGVKSGSGLAVKSATGGVAAGGLEVKVATVRLSGELRYTRWGAASVRSVLTGLAHSNLNQVDLLVGLTF